jgi:proteasome lid subunit RPN8/RPN11
VDPLAGKSPNQTPYHFVSNNPVMRIDPDGLTDFENSTTGDRVSVDDGMNQTVLIDSKNWQSAVDYSKNLDGNNPTDAYNSFISSNGGVAVPTASKGGVIPDKKMFMGFMEFKFKNETKEIAAFKAKGDENYYVDSWGQNSDCHFVSSHLVSTASMYGYSEDELTEIFHTHPNGYANPSVADAGLSYQLGIPVYSMGYSNTGMLTLVNGKSILGTEIHMATPRYLSPTDVLSRFRPRTSGLNFYGKQVNY